VAKYRPRQKELMRIYDEVLTDYIVKNRITKDFKIPRKLITPEMIEIKRNIILARRAVRRLDKMEALPILPPKMRENQNHKEAMDGTRF